MHKRIKNALRRYIPSSDIETYLSLIIATIITILALLTSSYNKINTNILITQSFLLCIISGSMGILGISISGVAIVIAMFTSKDIVFINKLKKGSFEEILSDFKFLSFHIAFSIVILSIMYFGEFINLPYKMAVFGTYVCIFLVFHYLTFTVLYSAALVKNCVRLSTLKQTIFKIEQQIYPKQMSTSCSERSLIRPTRQPRHSERPKSHRRRRLRPG